MACTNKFLAYKVRYAPIEEFFGGFFWGGEEFKITLSSIHTPCSLGLWVINTLIPAASLEIHPPATAPAKIPKNPNTRPFRLIFPVSGAASAGSDAKSHNTLVTTSVGISLMLEILLPTTCPADWELSSAIGISCFQSISWDARGSVPSTISPSNYCGSEYNH